MQPSRPTNPTLQPILDIKSVSKAYASKRNQIAVLEDISLQVMPQEFVCIIGESGCGKSTLLQMIAGFEDPTAGMIEANGVAVTGPDYSRGIVFQEASLLPWLTVEGNISLGLEIRGQEHHRAQRVTELVRLMGLVGFEKLYPAQLSGGMAQRVAIARVLVNDPHILLLDEPFGALDAFTRVRLQSELLRIWHHERITTIFVTHDIDEAVYLATRVVVMSARPGRVARIFNIALRHPRDRSSSEFVRLRNMIGREFLSVTGEK